MRRPTALTVLLVLACAAIAAPVDRARPAHADPLDGIGWLPSEAFDTGAGLPDPTVNAIASLPSGEVWIGTMRGLARMGGARAIAEPGPDGALERSILSLAATAQGDLFAAVEGGRVLLRQAGEWKSAGTPFGSQRTQRLRVFDDGGRQRVFASGGGVAEWTGSGWKPRPLPPALADREIFDVALEPGADGRPSTLWLASFGQGLYRCVGEEECTPVRIDLPGPRSDEVRTLRLQPLADGSRALWVGTYGGGMARWQHGAWTRWSSADSAIPSDFVLDFELVPGTDGDTEVWAGTRGGLAVLRHGREWSGADPRVPQMHERVRSIVRTRDSQGVPAVWAGSDTGAVRTRLSGAWRLVSRLGTHGNGIWGLWVERAGAGERVWLASDGEGLARYQAGNWTVFRSADGLPSDSVRSVMRVDDGEHRDEGGTLWVGTWGGRIARMQGERFVELPTPWPKTPGDAASVLLADRGDVWVGTREHGLARWNDGRWQWFPPDGRMPAWVYAAVRAGPDLWFSTADRGIARYRDGHWQFFGSEIGLPADRYYDLRIFPRSDGHPVLWVGSSNHGLQRLDIANPQRPRLLPADGLPALPVPKAYGAVRDGSGDLMICTDYGVFGWHPTGKGYTATAYHRQDGIPHDECNGNALRVDDLGRVWIGTVGGAAVYTPAPRAPRRPSPLLLTEVRVDGQPVAVPDRELQLPKPGSSMELHYALFTGEKESESRYRVSAPGEGAAPVWDAADSHVFAALPAGRQRIRIEARDFAGIAAAPLEFVVVVPQAWWKTPVARGFEAIAALLLFWAVLKWRERRLRQGEEQLRDMVQERTAQLQKREVELRAANDELRRLSYIDPLTGLGNRRRLFETLELQWRDAARRGESMALLLIDLDHFKRFNDSHGHQAGDTRLQQVAQAVTSLLPAGASAARYGGEELCVLLPGHEAGHAMDIAELMRFAIAALPADIALPEIDGIAVTASIGVAACVPGMEQRPDALIARADDALYAAKAAGRNRVVRAQP
jgi:diguanylate cyclase (GGDEF)-like protein